MSRRIRVHRGFRVTEGIEEGDEGVDLVGDFAFASRVRGQSQQLTDKQPAAGRLPRSGDTATDRCLSENVKKRIRRSQRTE